MTKPRFEYKKVTQVIPWGFKYERVLAIWDLFAHQGFTTSPHLADAGFGDLNQRHARVFGIPSGAKDNQDQTAKFYQVNYPGVIVHFLHDDGRKYRMIKTRPDRQEIRGAVVGGWEPPHVFRLLHPSLSRGLARQVFLDGWINGQATGWVPDDGGIGTWESKTVVCYGYGYLEEFVQIQEWFAHWYPGTQVELGEVPPYPWETPGANPGDRLVSISDSGSGTDALPGDEEE
jgi:hypothetical protein